MENNTTKKIYIGTDHAGYKLKEILKPFLVSLGHEVVDKGPFSFDKDDDYPDLIRPVAEAVASEEGSFGIILGGSGQGEAMVANRVVGVRAAVFYGLAVAKGAIDVSGAQSTDPYEIVKLARMHNNANILSLSARFLSVDEAKEAVRIFLATEFPGAERAVRRMIKIDEK